VYSVLYNHWLTIAFQRQLEANSPQIIGRDGEIWLQFIKRDIPDWEKKQHQPKHPKNWWKLYNWLSEQTKKDREQGAEKLKAALDAVNDEREQNLAKVVSRKELPKEPVNHKARILYHHTFTPRNMGPGQRKNGIMEKIRKETHEARWLRTRGLTSHPLHKLTEVTQAPRGLIEDYKRSVLHNNKSKTPAAMRAPIPPRTSKASLAVTMREKPVVDKSLQEREDRLRALTGARTPNKTTTAPESTRKVTDNQPKRPAVSPSTSKPTPSPSQRNSNTKRTLSQSDGPTGRIMEGTPPAKRNKVIGATGITTNKPMPAAAVNSPPQQRSGTPTILPRSSSPKRKAEVSVFMTAKRPKVMR
jgi:elongin-A